MLQQILLKLNDSSANNLNEEKDFYLAMPLIYNTGPRIFLVEHQTGFLLGGREAFDPPGFGLPLLRIFVCM